ncbi:hypothetical protein NSI01_23110 [Pimelobacter simplex]|nr:hypothetical protein NSI01_23110 [Pimelobacter simplex]
MDVGTDGDQLRDAALRDVATADDEHTAPGEAQTGRVRREVAHRDILSTVRERPLARANHRTTFG